MLRRGELQCVIVKDLSRFGRNYLAVGDYLDHIFPFLGIRFISANDHYDSAEHLGATGGIDIAFRNLVYQHYSRDLSQKVKSAMHIKMAKGQYITHCPYGYEKEPGIKHRMVMDPAAAPIVREIFLTAISGKKSTEIAAALNERNILTTSAYKSGAEKCAIWRHQSVLRIIKDYKYTGAMVNFKCENETMLAKSQKRRALDELVIAENSHDPIVFREEYALANADIRKVKPHKTVRHEQAGRVYYCGRCGRKLRKTFGADEYYSLAGQSYT